LYPVFPSRPSSQSGGLEKVKETAFTDRRPFMPKKVRWSQKSWEALQGSMAILRHPRNAADW
jgi:hypothetical protein